MTSSVEATAARRLLLVHAHPDDETITSGATMAQYAAAGAAVTLVTCTLGEEGEILVPELEQLAANQADQLGGWRIAELAQAMRELGVSDHRFLGGAGRFRDSGMMSTPANEHPRAFWRASQDRSVFYEAVLALVEVIRSTRPQVVVTYDDFGGYGHPDHIMAHRVTMAAVEAAAQPAYASAGGEPWTVAKLYWTTMPRSVMAAGLQALKDFPDSPFARIDSVRRTARSSFCSCLALLLPSPTISLPCSLPTVAKAFLTVRLARCTAPRRVGPVCLTVSWYSLAAARFFLPMAASSSEKCIFLMRERTDTALVIV